MLNYFEIKFACKNTKQVYFGVILMGLDVFRMDEQAALEKKEKYKRKLMSKNIEKNVGL